MGSSYISGHWALYLVCPPFKTIKEEKPTDTEINMLLVKNTRFPHYHDYLSFCQQTKMDPQRLFSILKYIQNNMQNEYRIHFSVNRMGSNASFKLEKKKINENLSLIQLLNEMPKVAKGHYNYVYKNFKIDVSQTGKLWYAEVDCGNN